MQNCLPKLLLLGGNGQVASALCNHPAAKLFAMVRLPRESLDITDANLASKITAIAPAIIVNAAAYTAVDQAEDERANCLSVNEFGPIQLAKVCAKQNIFLIHLSTDYVFNGEARAPYGETARTDPINFYGHSKLLGEVAIRSYCENHVILRVSSVFSAYGNNFLKTILRLAQKKSILNIVHNQITCPTSADAIAGAIFEIADKQSHVGTYHYCNKGPVSWADFAAAILESAALNFPLRVKNITRILAQDYPTRAKRPLYSVLDTNKIFTDYNIPQTEWLPHVQTAIQQLSVNHV